MLPSTVCDPHVHSVYSHDCKTPMHVIKDFARKHDLLLGITDHNEVRGSIAASAMGINTIPGIEVTTKSLKDFLIYFYDQDNLREFYQKTVKPSLNPGKVWGSKTQLTEQELFDELKSYACVTSLAHPFCPPPKRSAKLKKPIMSKIDAIEVVNFAMSARSNRKAAALCENLGKAHTGGSDSHHPTTLASVTMRSEAETPAEFLKDILKKQAMIVGVKRKNRDVFNKVRHYLETKRH